MIVDRARIAAALPAYELGRELGAGTFGLVLAGRHRRLGRDVAIKVLVAADGGCTSFTSEARVLAGIDHPHVVRVYDYVEDEGLDLIIMELLPGGSLTRRRVGLPPEGACAVGLAVAEALSCAHAQGVLHRDIKSDNLLFGPANLLKVTDFGIAKIFEGSTATASGVVGTPKYMAPEQIVGRRLGPPTDLYSLGIVLYELLAGGPPFDPKQPLLALYRCHLDAMPAVPAGVPQPVADVVMRALAKDPAGRYPSARAFALHLADAAARSYGPGWTGRSGILLRLDDEVRRAAEGPPPTLPGLQPATAGRLPSAPAGSHRRGVTPGQDPGIAGTHRRGRRLSAVVGVLAAAVTSAILILTTQPPSSDGRTTVRTATLTGHTNWVKAVAYAPDGRTLATAGADNVVILWDVTDPARATRTATLTDHSKTVWGLAFSPDGGILASAGDDATVILWNVADPARVTSMATITGHAGAVTAVAFSPGGRILATASHDRTVILWDVADAARPTRVGTLTGHSGAVWSMAFSPNGHTLATGSADNTAILWNTADPARLTRTATLTGHSRYVSALAFSPDGHILAAGSWDGTVLLFDVADPARARRAATVTSHSGAVYAVAFSPDGRTLATGSADDHVAVLWDVTDPARPSRAASLAGHAGPVQAAAFAPDGRMFATGSDDKSVILWAGR